MSQTDATDREGQTQDFPELWRVARIAEALDVSEPTVYKLMETGKLPYVQIGRCRRVKRTDVARFLREATVQRA